MKVVTFSIFKGGTAKTTSTVNSAAALVNKGQKVLVVDLDQQASATRYLDLDPEASPSLYEVFAGNQQASLAIRKNKHGIDVGVCQKSCPVPDQAASLILRSFVSRSGLRQTSPTGDQFRILRDHRVGLAARASV
jgi:Mrp family chromosome partitioning ATPase